MALNNEGQLVILSPFNEPSGVPFFKNYAPIALAHPSGLNFDWNVEITNSNTNEPQAVWPGTTEIFMPGSGTFHRGYAVQGTANTNAASTQTATEKCLILGFGGQASKFMLAPPPVAQSGFTIGYWVSPQSDGFTVQNLGGESLAQKHTILTKGNATNALYLGVSGSLAQADQFSQDIFASGLRTFACISAATVAAERTLWTPITSGKFTHVTFVYRVDPAGGTAHQISLFRDGHLAASGTTATALTVANTNWTATPLSIGGSFSTTITTRYIDAAGWGHLISGVYAYERPLDDGEILQIHDQGGLQVPNNITYPTYTPVDITDKSIVGYYPFISPGFIDVSRHHLNIFSNSDEGRNGDYIICPGPFNRAMVFNDTTTGVNRALGTPSGTIKEILYRGNGSFTIAGMFFLANVAQVGSSFDQTTLMSYGAVGSTNEFNPVRQTGGFQVSASGTTNSVRISARFYNGGLATLDNVTLLQHHDNNPLLAMSQHVAMVYDEQTFGVALYINGTLTQSGTLPASATPLHERLAFSGYPLLFLGGVPGETQDTYSNLGGDDCGVGEILIANRPFLPEEIRFIAESGLNITPLYYSVQDPRLRGYWPCTDSGGNDILIPDRSMIFTSGGIPGHLIKIMTDAEWLTLEGSDNRGQQLAVDMFSMGRSQTLGITSGTYAIMSASEGIGHTASTTGEHSRTSSSDLCQRYRMYSDQRDVRAPSFINEYVISFDVTPSGTIPAFFGGTGQDFNATLVYFGETSATDHVIIYLTSANAPAGSGITLVVQTQDLNSVQPLISGNIPYGATSKCLFHAKPLLPFNNSTSTPIQCSLFVNGAAVDKIQYANDVAQLYDSDGPGSSDNWLFQIGGRAAVDTSPTTLTTIWDGLGGIYLKNIFVAVGQFSPNDIDFLATSGIQGSSNVTNYKDTLNVSPVYVSDPRLVGNWRFSGPDAGSGVTDVSDQANDLTHLAREATAVASFVANAGNVANIMRFAPFPFLNTSLGIQASGFTFGGRSPPTVATTIAPYAFSGAIVQIPQSGFSVGCWIAPRSAQTSDAAVLLSYGPVSSTIGDTSFQDSSWALYIDNNNNICFTLSQDGSLTLSDSIAVPGSHQTRTKIARTLASETSSSIETFRQGQWQPGHIDSLVHIAFTYEHHDGFSGVCKGYHNGELVTSSIVPASGFHNPMVIESRMISFMIPQTSVWSWNASRGAVDPYITDVFYASAPLGAEEIRYISQFGISAPQTTTSSGCIGGFVSGINGIVAPIAGRVVGSDHASGVIGGILTGGLAASGYIGGYIHAQSLTVSGTIGGYIQGIVPVSGTIGGFVIGGAATTRMFDAGFIVEFNASSDFDALIRIQRTDESDFDAQVIVYQEERPPDVDIIIPSSTVMADAPLNQYFIGSGTALQGKYIVQTKWYFNDFSMPVFGTLSGVDLYPISHNFGQSGVYVVRFSVIDSKGIHNSATRVIDLSNGIDPVRLALSGVPDSGNAPLTIEFDQTIVTIPPDVSTLISILDFDDGQSSLVNNVSHIYTVPGKYNPIWVVKDSRGFIWCDSMVAGVNN